MATPTFVLSSDDVAKTPPGVSQVPLSVKFSPDGSLLTYLFPNHHGVRQVYAVNLTTKKEEGYEPYKLFDATTAGSGIDSLAEQLRKERMRLFVNGVSQYEWATQQEGNSSSRRIMLPLHGSVLLYENNTKESGTAAHQSPLQVLYDSATTGESAVDPQLSPKGNAVAFVLNDDLYVQYLSSTTTPTTPPIRITTNGSKEGISCGVADFIAQEEMDRYHGFWWSPCGTMIVYTEVDENHVPTFDILHQVALSSFEPSLSLTISCVFTNLSGLSFIVTFLHHTLSPYHYLLLSITASGQSGSPSRGDPPIPLHSLSPYHYLSLSITVSGQSGSPSRGDPPIPLRRSTQPIGQTGRGVSTHTTNNRYNGVAFFSQPYSTHLTFLL